MSRWAIEPAGSFPSMESSYEKELTAAEEATICALVKKAVS